MSVLEQIRDRAKSKRRRVVLPEGTEPRVIQAAVKIVEQGLAEVTLIGPFDQLTALAAEHGLDTSKVTLIDPQTSELTGKFVEDFMVLRKAKGITQPE
ncbi:MAG: phosphate acyltransferase, partial [bacterium]|nr:phosphate acyltransferase [bacterium]